MNVNKGNRIIADFMGDTKSPKVTGYEPYDYHSNWGSLQEVIVKIVKTGAHVAIEPMSAIPVEAVIVTPSGHLHASKKSSSIHRAIYKAIINYITEKQ